MLDFLVIISNILVRGLLVLKTNVIFIYFFRFVASLNDAQPC
jgi:hypothetical protein